MTRINCVPVKCLSDKHLLAEYKEITRPFNKVKERLDKGTYHEVQIPQSYTLGRGHETFFFDKLLYLHSRYFNLKTELQRRSFNVDMHQFRKIYNDQVDIFEGGVAWGNWYPSEEDIYLNMARLVKRCKYPKVLMELKAHD